MKRIPLTIILVICLFCANSQMKVDSTHVAYPLCIASFTDISIAKSLQNAIYKSNVPFQLQKDSIYIIEQEPYYELIGEITYDMVGYYDNHRGKNTGSVYFLTKDYGAYRSVWDKKEWSYRFQYKLSTEYGTFYIRSFTRPDFIIEKDTVTEHVLNAIYINNNIGDSLIENEKKHINLIEPFKYRIIYDKKKQAFKLISHTHFYLNNDSLDYCGYDNYFERFTIAEPKE